MESKNTAGNAAGNIRHLDPMWYSGNAANVPPTQLDTGRMTVTAGNQFYIGTPAGVKQVPLYTQRNISTSLMAYTAGTTTNTLSLNYQLTDGYASEITIVVRGIQTGVTGLLSVSMPNSRLQLWRGIQLRSFLLLIMILFIRCHCDSKFHWFTDSFLDYKQDNHRR